MAQLKYPFGILTLTIDANTSLDEAYLDAVKLANNPQRLDAWIFRVKGLYVATANLHQVNIFQNDPETPVIDVVEAWRF